MLFKTQSASVYGIPLGLKAGLVGRPLDAGFRNHPSVDQMKGYLPYGNDCQKVNPTCFVSWMEPFGRTVCAMRFGCVVSRTKATDGKAAVSLAFPELKV